MPTHFKEPRFKLCEGHLAKTSAAFERGFDKVCMFVENHPSKFGLTGEDYVVEANITCERCLVEVSLMSEIRTHKVRITMEFCIIEICIAAEGYAAEILCIDEGCSSDKFCFSNEDRFIKVRIIDECCIDKVSVIGENRPAEVCIAGESYTREISLSVELRRREITFLNCEVIEGIENWCSAEIELEVAPCTWARNYFSLFIFGEGAATFAHFNKNGTAYILFFVELCIVCGDILKVFKATRFFKTFVLSPELWGIFFERRCSFIFLKLVKIITSFICFNFFRGEEG